MYMMKKIPRIVKRHKYERLTPDNQIWWNNKFQELEASVKIPEHKKLSVLKKIFTQSELERLISTGIEYVNDEEETKDFGGQRVSIDITDNKSINSTDYIPARKTSSHKQQDEEEIRDFTNKTSVELTDYIPARKVSFHEQDVLIKYLNDFIKKPQDKVRIWSTKQKRDPNSYIPLMERAALVEETIAEEFDNWYSNMRNLSSSEINKELILKIFEITSSLPIKTGIVINKQDVEIVPNQIANYLGDSKHTSSVAIKRQINSDYKASKLETCNKAFSKMLPSHLRKIKHDTDTKLKWLTVETKHKELETFEAVFKDIMDLETSKGFLMWLRNHPDVAPPPFLQRTCMTVNKKATKK